MILQSIDLYMRQVKVLPITCCGIPPYIIVIHFFFRKVQRFILCHHSWSSYSTRVTVLNRENVEVFGRFSAWPLLNELG